LKKKQKNKKQKNKKQKKQKQKKISQVTTNNINQITNSRSFPAVTLGIAPAR
jgi:hypothetical protein